MLKWLENISEDHPRIFYGVRNALGLLAAILIVTGLGKLFEPALIKVMSHF